MDSAKKQHSAKYTQPLKRTNKPPQRPEEEWQRSFANTDEGRIVRAADRQNRGGC